jgi:DNA-damage-inducible protein D
VPVQRTDADGIEFWFARDLQTHLGYARWGSFQTAIQSAWNPAKPVAR